MRLSEKNTMEKLIGHLHNLLSTEQYEEASKIIKQSFQEISTLKGSKKLFIETQFY